MKKLLFCLFVFTIVLFSSCKTAPIIFNETLDSSEIALIYYSGVSIVEYNGISINWKPPAFGNLIIKIPGGPTQFVLNGTVGSQNVGYTTYRDVPFIFNFESGKEYTLYINQNMIVIHNGKSSSRSTHLASFNMRNGQTLTMENGVRIRN